MPGGKARHGEGTADFVTNAVRQQNHLRCRHDKQVAVTATHADRGHPLPDLQMPHALAQRLDHARRFNPGDNRLRYITAFVPSVLPHPDIAKIDPADGYPYANLPRTRRRI